MNGTQTSTCTLTSFTVPGIALTGSFLDIVERLTAASVDVGVLAALAIDSVSLATRTSTDICYSGSS